MTFFVILVALITVLVTFEFGSYPKIGVIRASAGLTLLALIDLNLINYFYAIDIDYFMAVIFGASFVGMSSKKRFTYLDMSWAALIYGILFLYFLPLLEGLGGALGLSAFISVVIIHLIKEIGKNLKAIFL